LQEKDLWRKVFQEFFIGDRVKVPDCERIATIVRKRWVKGDSYDPKPHWIYEVEFDHAMRLDSKFFHKTQRLCKGIKNLLFEEMELIRCHGKA